MRVPLVDLPAQWARIRAEVEPVVLARLAACDYVGGAAVAAFEQEFAAFCGAPHSVGCANGTDAIELLARASGLGDGDEVVIPANTFVATAVGLLRAGVRPVVADCDEEGALDPARLEEAIGPRTRAIMPVWLYGRIGRFDELAAVARARGLPIWEDAAQAHGASWNGVRAGALGDAAAFSLYPGKNLGAAGDAGVIVTGDARLAQACRDVRNYGSERRYEHPRFGYNSRLDTLQAAILSVKLRHLGRWNAERRLAARRYDERLRRLGAVRRPVLGGDDHVFHLYVVRIPRRDAVLDHLQAAGVGAAIHYPRPVHRLGATTALLVGARPTPIADARAAEILSLPLYPELTEAQIDFVVDALDNALQEAT